MGLKVNTLRNGLIKSGASDCPRNMLAAVLRDSHAVVPTVICNLKSILNEYSLTQM